MNKGRSYSQPADQPRAPKLQCPECKKSYSREAKLKEHIEKNHYLCTRDSKQYDLTLEDELKTFTAASEYLRDILDGRTFPVLGGDQDQFLKRLKESRVLIGCDWRQVFMDFHSFITMGLPYYDTNFCPTLLIDFLWHAVITKGHLKLDIPHCAKVRTPEEDHIRYLYFCEVFKAKTGRAPYTGNVLNLQCPTDEELSHVADQLRDLPGQIMENERQKDAMIQAAQATIQAAIQAAIQAQQAEAQRREKESLDIMMKERARRIAIQEAYEAELENDRRNFSKSINIDLPMEAYLRYKVIARNHPDVSKKECVMMARTGSHTCFRCDPVSTC